jgi:hypothetical protein
VIGGSIELSEGWTAGSAVAGFGAAGIAVIGNDPDAELAGGLVAVAGGGSAAWTPGRWAASRNTNEAAIRTAVELVWFGIRGV